jgi:hypothetical protein
LALAAVPGAAWSQDANPGSQAAGPAQSLYLQLGGIGLDPSRVYHLRDVSLDRSAIHLTLHDGTIAFTRDVGGQVTGAFFEGDGEVLLAPPTRAERTSIALFVGATILEEHFSSAYFRFSDDTFAEMRGALQPSDQADVFVAQWDETARNLARMDALQLFMKLSERVRAAEKRAAQASASEFWHARLQGRNLGTFDLYYDSRADEQIWAGQGKMAEGVAYFDLWTSFSPDHAASGAAAAADDFEIPQYKIRATIHLPTALDAEAWLQVDAGGGGQRTLLFELSRFLPVKRVEVDGREVEFIHNQALEGSALAALGNDQVAVALPAALRAKQRIQIHFVYGGDVLSDAGGGLVYVGARGAWYPNRRPAMSKFDLEFRYPAGWTLIATGQRVGETHPASGEAASNPGNEQVSHWVSERPMPMAGFNLGKYHRATARAGNVVVSTYASQEVEKAFPQAKTTVNLPAPIFPRGAVPRPRIMEIPEPSPSPARNAQSVADRAAQAIDFFSQNFGPYPYDSLSLTQKPGNVSQGWPGLIFLSSLSFLGEKEKSDLAMDPVQSTLSTSVIAHETAHEWWGDLITWNSYREQWLIESLADYSALMLLETEDPAKFHAVLQRYRENLMEKNKDGEPLISAGPVTLGERLSSSHFPNGYSVVSYERGVWLLHMLRSMLAEAERKGPSSGRGSIPDDSFLRTLRKLRNKYEGRTITTGELLRGFEENLPRPLWYEDRKSLDWFYDSWINGNSIPRFELQGLKLGEKSASGRVVTGTIVEKEAPGDLVTLIPVYAVTSGKEVLIGQVFADAGQTSFRLTAPGDTRKVVLDPHHELLAREK